MEQYEAAETREKSDTILTRIKTMNSKQISIVMDEKREYRIITGGEDGMILWWNITVPFNPEAVVPNLA